MKYHISICFPTKYSTLWKQFHFNGMTKCVWRLHWKCFESLSEQPESMLFSNIQFEDSRTKYNEMLTMVFLCLLHRFVARMRRYYEHPQPTKKKFIRHMRAFQSVRQSFVLYKEYSARNIRHPYEVENKRIQCGLQWSRKCRCWLSDNCFFYIGIGNTWWQVTVVFFCVACLIQWKGFQL